jgi:hypothetical protein
MHFLKVPCVDGYLLARISSDASAGLVGPASVRLGTTVLLTAGYNAGRVWDPRPKPHIPRYSGTNGLSASQFNRLPHQRPSAIPNL